MGLGLFQGLAQGRTVRPRRHHLDQVGDPSIYFRQLVLQILGVGFVGLGLEFGQDGLAIILDGLGAINLLADGGEQARLQPV